MGFGAIITSGDQHAPMAPDLLRWLIEARVEMELSERTKFALRFEDDLCGGDPIVMGKIKAGETVGVFVTDDTGQPHCLVSGPITRIRTAATTGGTGSWLEVHGEDKRAEMDRVAIQDAWTGKASVAVKTILSGYGFDPDVEETRIEYADEQHALPQRGTDLSFIEDIARKNNLEFWLTYEASTVAGTLKLDPIKAHLASSPSRSGSTPSFPPKLLADKGLVIDVSPPKDQCVTVTRFEAKVDYERPNAARGFGMDLKSGDKTDSKTESPDDAINAKAETIAMLNRKSRREALATPTGDPVEQQLTAEAQMTEAAWFVEVDCSTTLKLMKRPILPHQVIDVRHAGSQLSGPYQVKSAVHVITPVEHYMDFKLRANGLSEAKVTP